ncbi:hypothetical protein GJAV_G00267670 [Gymnothorax javanicus]|nr:hypothetical protein GJAV_G00267670 [Gymnothorax javanicus]
MAGLSYPAVPAKPKASVSPVPSYQGSPQGSPAHKAFSYLHSPGGTATLERSPLAKPLGQAINGEAQRPKKRTQSLTRHALSDGEADEDELPVVPSGSLASYATLTRRPGRSQLARPQNGSERNVGRSQSFAIRSRRRGPPPPPPKRLSSVSSSSSGAEAEPEAGGGVETESTGSVKSITAMLETGPSSSPVKLDKPVSPVPPPKPALPHPRDPAASRRRTLSEPGACQTDAPERDGAVKSDTEEDGRGGTAGLDGSSSPQNSSSECIPFAEEGNLTIKQRPKPAVPLKPGACAQNRRAARVQPEGVRHDREEPSEPGEGPAPKTPKTRLLAKTGQPPETGDCRQATPTILHCRCSRGPQCECQCGAEPGFRLPALGTSLPPAGPPLSQPARPGKAPAGVSGPEPVLVHRRLEQTSTSLEAALKAVERKLILEDNADGGTSTVKSAGNILDDIGNMFDDLADQLDAMLD